MVTEFASAIRTNCLPWVQCIFASTALCLILILDLDLYLWKKIGLEFIFRLRECYFTYYFLSTSVLPIVVWCMFQVALKHRAKKTLTQAFGAIGLKNSLGALPNLIFDRPIDEHTRILRLTKAHLPTSKFESLKESMESALQISIDEMRETREHGTIDIIYAHSPMPTLVHYDDHALKRDEFVIGAVRSGEIKTNFDSVPHLLIAGQTGGGKSTFLRQLITSLYVQNKDYHFTLIDLKGALEFQTFENLDRISVVGDPKVACSKLTSFKHELEKRYELLKTHNAKDLEAYLKIENAPKLSRHIVVIDEVAELFLASHFLPAKESQMAREVCSKIARLGRACGIHLIVGTQRPDARALDTQIKGQLTGKICFQMGDTASSMVVLSNTRARDLPGVPGRAIWQVGMKQIEVQVPFLSIDKAEETLAPYRKESEPSTIKSIQATRVLENKADESGAII